MFFRDIFNCIFFIEKHMYGFTQKLPHNIINDKNFAFHAKVVIFFLNNALGISHHRHIVKICLANGFYIIIVLKSEIERKLHEKRAKITCFSVIVFTVFMLHIKK